MKLMSSMLVLSCALLSGSNHAAVSALSTVSSPIIQKKINLNHASTEELTHAVKGIGHQRAIAIVQYRQKHGPFKTITDLAAVKGIGLHFIQTHRQALDATFVL